MDIYLVQINPMKILDNADRVAVIGQFIGLLQYLSRFSGYRIGIIS